ncbi:MAG: alpha/beta hydrolase [Dehalococcoidia bacterium]|nr:alpha/beta hydrolase [Dehalococcoidia bacterium]
MATEYDGFAHVQDTNLYYEVSGKGQPVLLISGLGGNAEMWLRQAEQLAEKYQVIRFDNRGAGRSDAADGPYTIQMMAADSVQLLDALDITTAHIVGSSMGGMIAQEVAIQYPDKALSLTLIATQCGGPHAFGAEEENATALRELATIDMTPQERARAWVPFTLSPEFRESNPDMVEEYVKITGQYPCSTDALRAQWSALMGYDSWERLQYVVAPTLILQGSQDKLVPPENADVLGVRIPDAEVVFIEGAGHSLAFESADRVNELMMDFFERKADGGMSPQD